MKVNVNPNLLKKEDVIIGPSLPNNDSSGARSSEVLTINTYEGGVPVKETLFGDHSVYLPDSRPGSRAIVRYLFDPVSFLRENFVDSSLFQARQSTLIDQLLERKHNLPIKLVETGPNRYQLVYAKADELYSATEVYLLGSGELYNRIDWPAYVDIPKKAFEAAFLTTGLLQGDSIIITDHDINTFRVYRDARANSAVLYDKVVMAIENRYYAGSTGTGVANFQMRYDVSSGKWQSIVQPQEWTINNQGQPHLKLSSSLEGLAAELTGEHKLFEAQFDIERIQLQAKLFNVAQQLGIPSALNQPKLEYYSLEYQEDKISSSHPSISRWESLRKEIYRVTDWMDQWFQRTLNYYQQLRSKETNPLQIASLDMKIQKSNEDLDRNRLYRVIANQSYENDLTWLWKQKKM